MNKIIFPLNDTSNSEGEEIVEKEKTVSLAKSSVGVSIIAAPEVVFTSTFSDISCVDTIVTIPRLFIRY